jgi:hypothetical protein
MLKLPNFPRPVLLAMLAVVMITGCSSTSHTDVVLPNGIHCQSESSGFFLWRSTSTSCVDAQGKTIGSYSNY